jgi:hypothetical protein
MKKSNKILLVIVLLLVVVFGVGQFFAFSNLSNNQVTPSATPTSTPVPATQVITYVPPAAASSTPTQSGSCWTSSIAAPFRSDAWRCSVGNSISDPCFEIPNSNNLYCGADPANLSSTSAFVLTLTKSLPAPEVLEGGVPQNWAWLIQLADGTLCSPFTGTEPIAQGGVAASYGCAPATPGGNGLYIFNLSASTSPWTADVGYLSAPTSGLPMVLDEQTVNVSTVWQ